MCGIAGIIDLKAEREIDRDALQRMIDAVAHRGPDGEGVFYAPGVGIGHRRLAVIDIEGGVQPFRTSDENGVLTFNGEIYNFREIAAALTEAGVRGRTRSDSEALAEAMNFWGADCLRQLRGMFAFGFWDERRKTLLLARDRFGEKPLYYGQTEDGFLVFASEIGALVASGLFSLNHRDEAVKDYFLYGYVPDPKAIFTGISKLPPGSYMTARKGRNTEINRYWNPSFNAEGGANFESSRQAVLERLDDCVRAQLVADAPLGAFLSGGVDSSAIIASMALSGTPVTACTIGFTHERFDERPYARRTAARYGARHFEETAELGGDIPIDQLAKMFGEPFADSSALPTYCVSRAARRHVKVALSGDGADEIFAGYRRYPYFAAEERVRSSLPQQIRRPVFQAAGRLYPKLDWAPRCFRLKTTLQALGEDRAPAYARTVSDLLPERARRMLSPDFLEATKGYDPVSVVADAGGGRRLDPLTYAQTVDLSTWLPGRMLTKIDRTSMAAGLEVRAPFLDHKFAEWALLLPRSFLLDIRGGKKILKSALVHRLDADILKRAKQGFAPPLAFWLRQDDGPLTRLTDSTLWRRSGYFSAETVDGMIDRHRAGSHNFSQELWALIMFDAFLRLPRN